MIGIKIDVIMLTKNSFKPWFPNCLLSIRENTPVNRLIVVDRFSTDGTINVIKKYFPNAQIIQGDWGLAKARQKGIEAAETEYIAFIDSDIVLATDWGEVMLDVLKRYSAIGGLHAKDLYVNAHLNRYWQWEKSYYYRLKNRREYPDVTLVNLSSLPQLKLRGLTHNTIVLREAVSDWSPPAILTVGEDHHLMLHVFRKGLLWCAVNKPMAIHYAFKDLEEVFRRGVIEGASSRFLPAYEIIDTDLMWSPTGLVQWIRLLTLVSLKSYVASLMMKDPFIFVHKVSFYAGCIKGYLRCSPLIPKVSDVSSKQ